MLYSYIVDEIQGSKAEDTMPWRTTIGVLSLLSSKECPEWPRLATERVLDRICTGWYEYGLCKQAYTPGMPVGSGGTLSCLDASTELTTAAEAQAAYMLDTCPAGAKIFAISGGSDPAFWMGLLRAEAERKGCDPGLVDSWDIRTQASGATADLGLH
jgi:hypothetical protein